MDRKVDRLESNNHERQDLVKGNLRMNSKQGRVLCRYVCVMPKERRCMRGESDGKRERERDKNI